MSDSLPPAAITEIAAGTMQLQPIDATSRAGAMAALGTLVRRATAVWVARDATTAVPRAYAALIANGGQFEVRSAPGLNGDAADAAEAREVIRRFAQNGLGLAAS
ncbi:MAG: hypothetical protein ACOYD0_06930 [Candidatus Nanopelagicales bacterium]